MRATWMPKEWLDPPGSSFSEEYRGDRSLWCAYVKVLDPIKRFSQFIQLRMIVRAKAFWMCFVVVQIFCETPGDADAIVRAGSATDLIEQDRERSLILFMIKGGFRSFSPWKYFQCVVAGPWQIFIDKANTRLGSRTNCPFEPWA